MAILLTDGLTNRLGAGLSRISPSAVVVNPETGVTAEDRSRIAIEVHNAAVEKKRQAKLRKKFLRRQQEAARTK